MPQPLKDSDETKLPHPELNPLLNPLLAENMGRWAEVYFTNPPEKREQAIAELLRELGDRSLPDTPAASPASGSEARASQPFQARADGDLLGESEADSWHESGASASGQTCGACGHKNSGLQRFCGMCGTSLSAPAQSSYSSPDAEPVATSSWSERGLSPAGVSEGASQEYSVEDAVRQIAGSNPSAGPFGPDRSRAASPVAERSSTENFFAPALPETQPDSERSFPGLNQERADEHDGEEQYGKEHYDEDRRERELTAPPERASAFESIPSFGVRSEGESESLPYRYRAYVGFVLVVVIGTLLYMMWRNKQNVSGAAVLQSQPSLSPSAPEPAPPRRGAAENSETKSDAPKGAVTQSLGGKNSAPAKVRPTAPARAEALSPKPNAARRPPPSVVPASTAPATPGGQSGSEELNRAEGYLQGKAGRSRDSQEAAKWLWRSVAKHNLTAALMLADLYVRGDGVAKSCDQARLLLDAAARKGSSAAAERLRNLSASGCQ
ncbi:MAG: hypothetical protein ABSF59_21570 [Candidatus Sulfotelmatobacter sp.]